MYVSINCSAHGGGRVVSASDLETSVSSSTPTSAIIYDAYNSIIKKKLKKKKKVLIVACCDQVQILTHCLVYLFVFLKTGRTHDNIYTSSSSHAFTSCL